MTQSVRLMLLCSLIPLGAHPEEPRAAPAQDTCLMLNNRILGPRIHDRPLPLLVGNKEVGFRRACSVPWSTLDPNNEALPVQACFRGTLLQIENTGACGAQTGPLWIDARWVVTSTDLMQPASRIALCQGLETGAYAGTRAFSLECAEQAANAARTGDEKRNERPAEPEHAAQVPAASALVPQAAGAQK